MDKQAVIEKVKAQTRDGKIACKQALKTAADEGIPSDDLGDILNELKVKAAGCQLGCFP